MNIRDLPSWEKRRGTNRPTNGRPRRVYVRCIPLPGGLPLPFTLTLEASYVCCSFAVNVMAATLVTECVRILDWHCPRGDYLHTRCFWAMGYGRRLEMVGERE